VRLAYNANGHVTNRWTPEFRQHHLLSGCPGNVTNVVYPAYSVSYYLDGLSRVTNMVDLVGTNHFHLDSAKAWRAEWPVVNESGPWSGDTETIRLRSRPPHFVQHRLTRSPFNLSYDSAWRMTNLTSSAGNFGYQYPASSDHASRFAHHPAQLVLRHESLRFAWPSGLHRLSHYWGHVLDGYSYTHDLLGLRTNVTRDFGLTTNIVAIGYFDAIEQLTYWSGKESDGTHA